MMETESDSKHENLVDEASEEDIKWRNDWAEVFALLHQAKMESRASEFVEAMVTLRKNADTLQRQRETVKKSCEQLLHTAYREALQAHLKAMMGEVSAGVSPEVAEASAKTVEELSARVRASKTSVAVA
mmetsp:Transcript_15294/g.30062  ORF Transcript_15294/g.30062 Transcript_15294/m.30062 type:complete len:129 (+) Transcript_15294:40-426(+)|eukprot:CAMPEP_0172673664 /NCGR_PEP_ID=MMETSP1074-20121228/12286_1 /TAXON_ID=2916 /ORGANISM="Ceratium fusus, Strain PA161109" /LENGTH=128 /DNA_ID=CAMNT_0013490993 /DNA_START=35 /DNA_END=421 /DNA_ORIENTATION=+